MQALTPPSSVHDLPSALTDPESRQDLDNVEADKVVQSQISGSNTGESCVGTGKHPLVS